jgi:hypothetical protein
MNPNQILWLNNINAGNEAYLKHAAERFIRTDMAHEYWYEITYVNNGQSFFLNDAVIAIFKVCDGVKIHLATVYAMSVLGNSVSDFIPNSECVDACEPYIQPNPNEPVVCPTILITYAQGEEDTVFTFTSVEALTTMYLVIYPDLSEPIIIGNVNVSSGSYTYPGVLDGTYLFAYSDLCKYQVIVSGGVSPTTTTTTTTTNDCTIDISYSEMLVGEIESVLFEDASGVNEGPYLIEFTDTFGRFYSFGGEFLPRLFRTDTDRLTTVAGTWVFYLRGLETCSQTIVTVQPTTTTTTTTTSTTTTTTSTTTTTTTTTCPPNNIGYEFFGFGQTGIVFNGTPTGPFTITSPSAVVYTGITLPFSFSTEVGTWVFQNGGCSYNVVVVLPTTTTTTTTSTTTTTTTTTCPPNNLTFIIEADGTITIDGDIPGPYDSIIDPDGNVLTTGAYLPFSFTGLSGTYILVIGDCSWTIDIPVYLDQMYGTKEEACAAESRIYTAAYKAMDVYLSAPAIVTNPVFSDSDATIPYPDGFYYTLEGNVIQVTTGVIVAIYNC